MVHEDFPRAVWMRIVLRGSVFRSLASLISLLKSICLRTVWSLWIFFPLPFHNEPSPIFINSGYTNSALVQAWGTSHRRLTSWRLASVGALSCFQGPWDSCFWGLHVCWTMGSKRRALAGNHRTWGGASSCTGWKTGPGNPFRSCALRKFGVSLACLGWELGEKSDSEG